MPEYRRAYIPGSTVFLTLVTYQRRPLFTSENAIAHLRHALHTVLLETPFQFVAGVVLPDHLHFLWTLPANDSNYSRRIGRMKVLVTQALRGKRTLPTTVSLSRQKHRESDVWQRRFWEHTIQDEADFQKHFDYLHYNPVNHGLVNCPHEWEISSFHHWVSWGVYEETWGCGDQPDPAMLAITLAGE
jgi:putative transposase